MTTKGDYYIIGKGGLFTIIREILGDESFKGYFDDRESLNEAYYLGGIKKISDDRDKSMSPVSRGKQSYFIAIGAARNMLLRAKIAHSLKEQGLLSSNAISQYSFIARSVILGRGSVICPFACVHSNVELSDCSIVFSNSTIEHDTKIGKNANIAPGVTIAGSVTIGDNVFIGAGSTLIDGLTIGSNVLIGAGSLVLNDIEDNYIAYGHPCKQIKRNDIYIKV
jgi:sugar O-acyltransferase (sialic acid O-acetyltransferase NeuD family)